MTTTTGVNRTQTYVWGALCVITVLSWWLAPGHDNAGSAVRSVGITIAVIALGLVKCRLIIRSFMEVRGAPRWLKMATDAWLLVLWLAILVIYLI